MDKNLQIPGQYIIRFQTAPVVPAPFAHFYTLKMDIQSAQDLRVDFDIVYNDREELTEDELVGAALEPLFGRALEKTEKLRTGLERAGMLDGHQPGQRERRIEVIR